MKRITDFDKEESLTHFETTVKEAKIKMVLSNNGKKTSSTADTVNLSEWVKSRPIFDDEDEK